MRAREWLYPANVLTELRIVAIPAMAWATWRGRFGWAFAIVAAAGVSDGLDGYLARRLKQQSALGAALDPLADKGLLSTMFIVLALVGQLPWALTILVYTRDASILTAAAVLFWGTGFRDFRPSWWGKACTTAELATVGATMWCAAMPGAFLRGLERFGWFSVTVLSLWSGIHYSFSCAARYHATQRRGAAS